MGIKDMFDGIQRNLKRKVDGNRDYEERRYRDDDDDDRRSYRDRDYEERRYRDDDDDDD